MTFEDWFAVAAILLCLLASFFFAGSETALTASSRATMLRLQQDGNRNAGTVNRLLAARERLIGALLLGNNAVNILASSLATSVFLVWFGDVGVIYATGLMTVPHDPDWPGIVALSGDASLRTRRAMLADGADDFILRPCPGPDLARRVARVAHMVWGQRRALLLARAIDLATIDALRPGDSLDSG
jgi:PleD family two-component response regulator